MIGIINSAYLVSAAMAAFASLKSKSRSGACWWLVLSLGFCILGVLRTVEAGVWTDAYLRNGLFELRWYDDRRPIQVISIAVFALALLPALRLLPSGRIALTMAVFAFYGLMVFGALPFSSLHWSDALLGEQVGPVMLSHGIQVSLLLVAGSAAASECFFSSKGPREDIS